MKKIALPLLFLLLSMSAFAQTTHTFTFGSDLSAGQHTGCAAFTTIDGNDSDQAIGYAGSVCWPGTSENPWWGMFAPNGPYENPDGTFCTPGVGICEWGFPNNGDLQNNNVSPSSIGPYTWGTGCGPKTNGCIGTQSATSVFSGYGAGVTVSITVNSLVTKHSRFGRGCYPCVWFTIDETGGSGTATF